MTPLETEANPNIRVGPLRWGRPLCQAREAFQLTAILSFLAFRPTPNISFYLSWLTTLLNECGNFDYGRYCSSNLMIYSN